MIYMLCSSAISNIYSFQLKDAFLKVHSEVKDLGLKRGPKWFSVYMCNMHNSIWNGQQQFQKQIYLF